MRTTRLYVYLGALALLIVGAGISQSGKLNFFNTNHEPADVTMSSANALSTPVAYVTPYAAPATPIGFGTWVVNPEGTAVMLPPFPPDEAPNSATSSRLDPGQLGFPAIRPRLPVVKATDAAFTAADVQEWHATNEANGVGGHISSVPVTIEKIEFATQKELTDRNTRYFNDVPDDTLLCLVIYRGAFAVPKDHNNIGQRTQSTGQDSTAITLGYELFVAQTGNLIASGLGDNLR